MNPAATVCINDRIIHAKTRINHRHRSVTHLFPNRFVRKRINLVTGKEKETTEKERERKQTAAE